MSGTTAEIVICGAGAAGVAAAWHLAVRRGARGVVLVDEREPLSFTSDKGTEAFRNWWPGPGDAMVALMNRSIDLLEEVARETGDAFRLQRRGYVFLTAEPSRIAEWREAARATCARGAGAFRESTTGASADATSGADLVVGREAVRRAFPFVTGDAMAFLHVRRCGWLEARRMYGWMLERAQEAGVVLVRDRVVSATFSAGRLEGVQLASGSRIAARALVLAAGPLLAAAGRALDLELPVFNELHLKVAFDDVEGVIPRDVPMLIWTDPVRLEWSSVERRRLAHRPDLLGELPGGVHLRPRDDAGRRTILGIWTWDTRPRDVVWPPEIDREYGEAVVRGLTRMIPELRRCFGRAGARLVDGGYYCKTRENRPLIGPVGGAGVWVLGALSGFGIMASPAAGELLAAHLLGGPLPPWAGAFRPDRYEDPAYLEAFRDPTGGQL